MTPTPRPVVANIYYGTYDQTFVALNPATGAVRWTFSRGHSIFDPIIAGGLVYAETTDQSSNSLTLYALDSANGDVVWSATGGAYPTVAGGSVYVSTGHAVDCLDAATGKLRWHHPAENENLGITGLQVVDDTVYVVAGSNSSPGAPLAASLTALDAADGTVRWTFARDHARFNAPLIGNGVAYFLSLVDEPPNLLSGVLYAFKVQDGSRIWSVEAPAIANTFALADGVLFAGGSAIGITAFRTSDGARLWANTDSQLSYFIAVGQAVYVKSFNGNVIAFNAMTGKQLWSIIFPVTGPATFPVAAPNGLLYVVGGRSSGQLVAIQMDTGGLAWQQQVPGTPGVPVVAGDTLYVYNAQPDSGPSPTVYAFDASTGVLKWQHQTGKNLETGLVVTGAASDE